MKLIRVSAAVAALAACASARGQGGSAASACAPVTGGLPVSATLAPMAGQFVMTMHATDGPRRSEVVAGYITLRIAPTGQPAPAAGTRTALIGGTDIRLESVGALRLGDTGGDDPRAPGIAVYETRAGGGVPSVMARVGSLTTAAPQPGMTPIEGSHTALTVRRITASGFAGSWSSGDGSVTGGARGHFCAVRVP